MVKAPTDFAQRNNPAALHFDTHSTTITIGMIGDILLHHPLYTYDNYDFAFAGVKDQADWYRFFIGQSRVDAWRNGAWIDRVSEL